MSEDIKIEYNTEINEDGEEEYDGYTITFDADNEDLAEQYEQIWQLNCEEECMGADDYDECFERCMEEYRD